jgi:hypothetical protein
MRHWLMTDLLGLRYVTDCHYSLPPFYQERLNQIIQLIMNGRHHHKVTRIQNQHIFGPENSHLDTTKMFDNSDCVPDLR